MVFRPTRASPVVISQREKPRLMRGRERCVLVGRREREKRVVLGGQRAGGKW